MNDGMTFPELCIVVIIMSFVAAFSIRFTQSVGSAQKKFSGSAQLQMDSHRAFNKLVDQIREGTEVIRPASGETLPFLVFKDVINRTVILYLEADNTNAEKLKSEVFQLVSYYSDYSGSYAENHERIMLTSVRRLTFTSISPASVLVNATVTNDQGEYQFISHIGLASLGGME